MHVARRPSVLLVGVLVASVATIVPARASDPSARTTVAVEGTVRAVVVDRFGPHAAEDQRFSIVTDDGAQIPVDLPQDTPANGRFEGELVVDGAVEDALAAKHLLPREGSTIAQDTTAGRVAVAEAQRQDEPLDVAASTVAPAASAAVTTPMAHRAYVAVMTNRGSVEESDAQVSTIVDDLMGYWKTEAGTAISSFTRPKSIERFASAEAGPISDSCGMASDPQLVWDEAADIFVQKYGVSFAPGSGNHLFVAMADECSGSLPTDAGVAGVATVGSDFSSDGSMSFSLGGIAKQVGIHEIGHTFGLGHANLDVCPASKVCGTGEYFDLFSPMALAVDRRASDPAFTSPALDSAFRTRLGVAAAGEVPVVTMADGSPTRTVRVNPRSDMSGARGAEVVDPSSDKHYFVDYRSGTGRDGTSFYASPGSVTGLPVTYDPGVTVTTLSRTGQLTLATSTGSAGRGGSWTMGQTFTTPGLQIAVTSVTASGADVTVTFPGSVASAPAPSAPASFVSAKPRISGSARVGRTLRVRVGAWSPQPAFRYQWFANGRAIASKGTKSSFRLTSRQKGKRITVRVTGTRTGYATLSTTSGRTRKVAGR